MDTPLQAWLLYHKCPTNPLSKAQCRQQNERACQGLVKDSPIFKNFSTRGIHCIPAMTSGVGWWLGGATRVSGIAKVMSENAGQLAQKVGESLTNPWLALYDRFSVDQPLQPLVVYISKMTCDFYFFIPDGSACVLHNCSMLENSIRITHLWFASSIYSSHISVCQHEWYYPDTSAM